MLKHLKQNDKGLNLNKKIKRNLAVRIYKLKQKLI